ncbi:hypothetical protein AAG570_011303 [Ranatra chinensis]|uniref:Protein tipE n=1 Tax=Ranatra chinensis TaxID=642074 RepID=A0ABD0YK87_9HEMI
MPKQKKVPVEDLIVPPQDNRIVGTIFMCQMTAVLSCVALVYLSVAIYIPSIRAFESGIGEDPVMCTTSRTVVTDNCDWGSCGEWCLSKTSGPCSQIYVSLRNNGSDLLFVNCTNTANKTCYGIDQENAKKYRCIADECRNLTGTFNCSSINKGSCINITDAFECVFKTTDPPIKCSGRRGKINCIDLEGLQSCNRGTCERIRTPYNCDRRCVDIPTRNKNVILLSGDKAYLSQCQKVFVKDTDQEVWSENQDNVLMASCYNVEIAGMGMVGVDCINGTLLDKNMLTDLANFTYLNYLSVINTNLMDEKRLVAPPEMDLLIANESKLMINMEGCVNTLRDECKDFLKEYGKDGTDHNARGRFPCYYAEHNTEIVVARFNLETTYKEFMFASVVPSVLFVVSCLTLILCQRTVVVGDDAKMRFKKRGSGGDSRQDKENSVGDTGETAIMGANTEGNLLAGVSVDALMEKAKFYTSLCLGTTAILSVFGFLFLIPFVVDPAISTILADYEPVPVTCVTVDHVYTEGLSNCSWASCREGCTTAALRCHQILVNYTKLPFHEWQKANINLESIEWDVGETRFYINTEGCGYPPRVNCTEFAKQYSALHTPFPCYYSRTYPNTVVARYSWEDNLRHLILSLIVPNVLFGVSIGVLSYWYCPGCNRGRCPIDKTSYGEKFNSKDE